jgi:hypothetical protein
MRDRPHECASIAINLRRGAGNRPNHRSGALFVARRPACGYQRRSRGRSCRYVRVSDRPHGEAAAWPARPARDANCGSSRPYGTLGFLRLLHASGIRWRGGTPYYLTAGKRSQNGGKEIAATVKASNSNNDAATKRLMTIHCVNIPRPEKSSAKAPTSHLKRVAAAPISHSRNHSSGLSVCGHRNMMLESDLLTSNRSHIVLIGNQEPA